MVAVATVIVMMAVAAVLAIFIVAAVAAFPAIVIARAFTATAVFATTFCAFFVPFFVFALFVVGHRHGHEQCGNGKGAAP